MTAAQQGPFHAVPDELAGSSEDASWRFEVRPSLWAAADVPLRFLGSLFLLFLPFGVVGLSLSQSNPGGALGTFLIGTITIYEIAPALIVPFLPALRILFTRYIVTNDEILIYTQILSKTERRIPWDKVTTVRQSITILDRLVGTARLNVSAYGLRGTTFHLVGLRDVDVLRNIIARKMRRNATIDALMSAD